MSKLNFFQQVFILGLLSITNSVVAGQTTKYTGTVYATPVKNLMPLGNGDAVVISQSAGIVAMSGEPPTIHALSCSGMGLQKQDESTTTDFYCNLKENSEDSFDIKGNAGNETGGEINVIGGSGKWAGAKGKGKFVRVIQSEEGNKNVFEVEITVP
jgi:hypothetical protein